MILGLWPLILCICFRVIAIAQADSDPMKAWIKLDLQDGEAKIQALFFNGTTQSQKLYYDLQVLRTGSSGTATNQQSGFFSILPDETKTLAKTQFYANSRSFYKITLNIYDELDLILTDSLVNGNAPNKTVFQQKPQKQLGTKPKPVQPIKTAPSTSPPSPSKPIVKTFGDNLEIDGLIIDETRSKIGRDFYDLFYHRWIAPVGASNFSILIKELPSRGRGARVSISVNDQEVVQRFVPPRFDNLEVQVNYAIRSTRQHLQNNEALKKQMQEGDQNGSGIF
ncbi:MAG: curli-like amyloid fiber formation chaperone CsgH [Bacteroidota bacterium]